ncbi:MAG: hypothetical protein B1H12_08920 [Desulfobacteraceae bacterium 4484_190.2]|nr:MAG: hypothetical protein B1H12_08920 [Desulfobacteraceae bacterium 4484_190.2]
MSTRRKLEWLILAATAGLLILLKWLHIGVTNYNIFLLILIGWSLGVILAFRIMSGPDRSGQNR